MNTPQRIWTIETGPGPIVATAVHDGHAVRDDIEPFFKLSAPERLREEDPFTRDLDRGGGDACQGYPLSL